MPSVVDLVQLYISLLYSFCAKVELSRIKWVDFTEKTHVLCWFSRLCISSKASALLQVNLISHSLVLTLLQKPVVAPFILTGHDRCQS